MKITVHVSRDVVRYGEELEEKWSLSFSTLANQSEAQVRVEDRQGSKPKTVTSGIKLADVPDIILEKALDALVDAKNEVNAL